MHKCSNAKKHNSENGKVDVGGALRPGRGSC